MKLLLAIFTACLLAAAVLLVANGRAALSQPAEATPATQFPVERLFIIDGCIVYRFGDAAHPSYFWNCPKRATPQGAPAPAKTALTEAAP